MSIGVTRSPLVSPEDYLAGEEASDVKHEYLSGMVYAKSGGTLGHGLISANIITRLNSQLRNKLCRSFGSDVLVRIQDEEDLRFYYPDATIHCGSMQLNSRAISDPVVVFEVLSESRRRTDTGEKWMAYLTIPTLEAYVLADSEEREVTVWRQKAGKWQAEVFSRPEATLVFSSADCSLTIGEIYEGTGL